jgi:hypothetical protein
MFGLNKTATKIMSHFPLQLLRNVDTDEVASLTRPVIPEVNIMSFTCDDPATRNVNF